MIEMIADSGMSFNWVERPSTRRFIECLRPSAIQCLPTRRMMSGKLLRDSAKSHREDILPKMQELNKVFKCEYFFVCDGWVDVSKRHVLGCVVAISNLWFAHDEAIGKGNLIMDDRHDGIAVAEQIEKAFLKTETDFGIKFGGVTTDDARQCQRAKRILALRHPHMYFGKCFAHQINLIVKDVFKVAYMNVVDRARALVAKYNASTSKWLTRLAKECKSLYGLSPTLLRIIDVRWNSIQAAMASILRIKSAIKIIDAKYSGDRDFPKELKVDDNFFLQMKNAEQAVRPNKLFDH